MGAAACHPDCRSAHTEHSRTSRLKPQLPQDGLTQALRLRARDLARVRQAHAERVADGGRARRQRNDAIRHVDRFLDIVRDQQHGMALFVEDALQLGSHAQTRQRIESRERLVHVQNLGLYDQGARELDAFEHAARQLVRVGRLEPLQSDHRGVVFGEGALVAVTVAFQAEYQVLLYRQPGEHGSVLRDHDALCARANAFDAVDLDPAEILPLKSGNDVHQSRLAAARWPDDRDELAVVNAEAHAIDDR